VKVKKIRIQGQQVKGTLALGISFRRGAGHRLVSSTMEHELGRAYTNRGKNFDGVVEKETSDKKKKTRKIKNKKPVMQTFDEARPPSSGAVHKIPNDQKNRGHQGEKGGKNKVTVGKRVSYLENDSKVRRFKGNKAKGRRRELRRSKARGGVSRS